MRILKRERHGLTALDPALFSRLPLLLRWLAALASLPGAYQDLLSLGRPSLRLWRPVTTTLLKFIRLAIGPESPVEEAAIARLHRAGLMKDGKVIRRNS